RTAGVPQAMVGAPVIPVTEKEREEFPPERPLIPGLPPRPQAITAPDVELTEPPVVVIPAAEAADSASGGPGVQPATVPNRTAAAASLPETSAAPTAVQDPPATRRVEMQLRARTPRLTAQDAAGATGPEGTSEAGDDAPVDEDGDVLPKRVPGQQ